MFKSIQRGMLPLVGGGTAKGVWVYATDCAAACVRAIDADVPSGRMYFVDDGCGPLTLRQMLADAERALERRALFRANLPAPVFMTIARGVQAFGKVANRAVMLTPREGQHAATALGLLVGGHPPRAGLGAQGAVVGGGEARGGLVPGKRLALDLTP